MEASAAWVPWRCGLMLAQLVLTIMLLGGSRVRCNFHMAVCSAAAVYSSLQSHFILA